MTGDTTIETHLSRVTLRGERVYKRLKPVRFAFVDFSTLEKRKAACEAELSHNAPWAPGVYLGVLPVSGDPPRFGTPDTPDDYAIEMVRLPDSARLREHTETTDAPTMERIGASLRKVHDTLESRPASAEPPQVEARMRENLAELCEFELPIDPQRLQAALDHALNEATAALEQRAHTGQALHGDLRTEHVYLLEDRVIALDGVAFNEALAEGDPVEDIAFLAMELACVHGRWDLEDALWQGWAGGDAIPRSLRDLYAGHRSLIRAKIHAIGGKADRVRFHLLHALARFESSLRRPALVGVGGLPGVGKSTLSTLLERFLGFTVIRSDVVRKQDDATPSYTLEARNAVYQTLFAAAEAHLTRGERVVLDASFGREAWREGLLDVARAAGVRGLLLFAHAPEPIVAQRLAKRVNDPSDADLTVHHKARDAWEASSENTARATRWIDTGGAPSAALHEALAALHGIGIAPEVLSPRPAEPTASDWSTP